MLRGELVNLRAVERADSELLWRWLNDPDLMRGWGLPAASPSRDSVRFRIEQWIDLEGRLGRPVGFVIERLHGAPVGLLLALPGEPDGHGADCSIFIADPRARGQGLGRDTLETVIEAAFDHWGLRRLALRAEADNDAAIRLYRRCGFQPEGRQRDASFFDGAFHDVLLYSLLTTDPREHDG